MTNYTSDLTPEQFEEIEPYLPVKKKTRSGKWSYHQITNTILYVSVTGCQWRNLHGDLPPWKTVHRYFKEWKDEGALEQFLKKLARGYHMVMGRNPLPAKGIIDSQEEQKGILLQIRMEYLSLLKYLQPANPKRLLS
jgi:transposase